MQIRSHALLAAAALCLAGCASVSHTRPVFSPDGKLVGIETERGAAFLMKGEIEKLNTRTKDGGYSHSLSMSGLAGQGDAETLRAGAEGIAKGFMEGLKASGGIPPAP